MNIIKLSAIGSTNDYLKDISKKMHLDDGTVVFTDSQKRGKGQQGESWYSKAGESLTFSMFKRFSNLKILQQFSINLAATLGVKNALQELGVNQVTIKWPNDILADRHKLCGILIENRINGSKVDSAVIGVGINVNNLLFDDLPQASSMLIKTNQHYHLEQVLGTVVQHMMALLSQVNEPTFSLQQEFEASLFGKDVVSVFEDTLAHRFNAIVRGVSDQGELLLELENGSLRKFQNKQLKMLY